MNEIENKKKKESTLKLRQNQVEFHRLNEKLAKEKQIRFQLIASDLSVRIVWPQSVQNPTDTRKGLQWIRK